MAYLRVIPRDLFNEANLLKCYGQLYLRIEHLNAPNVELTNDGEAFDVWQHTDSGALSLSNVSLTVRGEECALHRPLNSREEWPLYLTKEDGDEISVFEDDGTFSADMLAFLKSTD